MKPGWERLLSLLVHIQANLEEDLSLAALARHAERSPSQLHRAFQGAIGETPKQYVTRLRLERAAWRLRLHDATVVEVALDAGFHNHETFTRAFRRRFGCPPSVYRARPPRTPPAPARSPGLLAPFELSSTRVRRLRDQHLAFVRHVGPYEAVPGTLFDELESWARRRRLPGPRLWLGIGHDVPGTTAPQHLRFDAALVVPAPFEARGRVGYQHLTGADYAVTTHVGPFDTLPEAYARVFPRALALRGVRLIGVPAVEIYHCVQVDPTRRLNETELCLPVSRVLG